MSVYPIRSCIPAHVPAHLVRDVDIYNIPGGREDPFRAWAKVQHDTPDIYYTPLYGGYWVLNRAQHIAEVLHDAELFSSKRGAIIPETPADAPAFAPLQSDPPEHRFFRHPFNLALSPQRVASLLGPRAREVVIERIESFVAKGECEFMHEVALHVPVAIVMQMFDLPYSDRVRLLPHVDTITHCSDVEERDRAMLAVSAYAAEWVGQRAQQPGEDVISRLLQIKVGERPVEMHEIVATVTLLLLGGLDSVSHTMGFVMRFLAEHPDHQTEIASNPTLIRTALEELLRRHSLTTTTRTLTRDKELGGVRMKAGDRIMCVLALAGLDEKAWTNPMEVDFARCPKDILTFGKGIHKCVGMNLARAELTVLLEEWFKRIPRFSIKQGDTPRTMSGQNQGMIHLPLAWPFGGTDIRQGPVLRPLSCPASGAFMPTIVFIDAEGTEYEVAAEVGQSIMQAAVNAGVPGILADCGGSASCGTCHGYIDAEWGRRVPAPSSSECDLLQCVLDPHENSRLTCQLNMTDELDRIVIRLPKSQI